MYDTWIAGLTISRTKCAIGMPWIATVGCLRVLWKTSGAEEGCDNPRLASSSINKGSPRIYQCNCVLQDLHCGFLNCCCADFPTVSKGFQVYLVPWRPGCNEWAQMTTYARPDPYLTRFLTSALEQMSMPLRRLDGVLYAIRLKTMPGQFESGIWSFAELTTRWLAYIRLSHFHVKHIQETRMAPCRDMALACRPIRRWRKWCRWEITFLSRSGWTLW